MCGQRVEQRQQLGRGAVAAHGAIAAVGRHHRCAEAAAARRHEAAAADGTVTDGH